MGRQLTNLPLLSLAFVLLPINVGATTIDLANFVSGTLGLQIVGDSAETNAGYSVAIAGDFNKDGNPDYIVGSPSMGTRGAAFIFLGGDSQAEIDTSNFVSGSKGMKVIGANAGDELGYSVGAAGDVNDDGYDDVLIGAPMAGSDSRPSSGVVYVIFGRNGPYSDLWLTGFTAGSAGFKIMGDAANTRLGSSPNCLRGALGDINGDGVDDFAVGSTGSHYDDRESSGAVYVLYGKPHSEGVAAIDLADDLDGKGFKIGGAEAGDHLGSAISGTCDLNGDGIRDLIIGCPHCDPDGREDAGAVYMIFCKHDMDEMDLADFATGDHGVKFLGGAASDQLGSAVSCGDVNGDGKSDLILGAPGTAAHSCSDTGCVHVYYGSSDWPTSDVDFHDFHSGPAGYSVCGKECGSRLGTAVAIAGDVNLDGVLDLLLGAGGNDGCAFVLPGCVDDIIDDIDLRDIGDIDACVILPPNPLSGLGLCLDGGVDLTMGGLPNLLLGACEANPIIGGIIRVHAGSTFVIQCRGMGTRPPVARPTASPNGAPVPNPVPNPTRAPTKGPPPHPVPNPVPNPTRAPTKGPPPHPVPNPTREPTRSPTMDEPRGGQTRQPTRQPTREPTRAPTMEPTREPTREPTMEPTREPTRQPTRQPTMEPTREPTRQPTMEPTREPTVAPTREPTMEPTRQPTPSPTRSPTSASPTAFPTRQPTLSPTGMTVAPTMAPTARPTKSEDGGHGVICIVQQILNCGCAAEMFESLKLAVELTIQAAVADCVDGVAPAAVTNIRLVAMLGGRKKKDPHVLRGPSALAEEEEEELTMIEYTVTSHDPGVSSEHLKAQLEEASNNGVLQENIHHYAAEYDAFTLTDVTVSDTKVTPQATAEESSDSNSNLSGGQIAGIVIGVVAFVALAVVIAGCALQSRNKREAVNTDSPVRANPSHARSVL